MTHFKPVPLTTAVLGALFAVPAFADTASPPRNHDRAS